jgi:hypothetical protein
MVILNPDNCDDFLSALSLEFQDEPPLVIQAHRMLVRSIAFQLLES